MMEKEYRANKYVTGDIVCAKLDTSVKLVVTHHVDRVYHCKMLAHPDGKDVVYFEKDLISTVNRVYLIKVK